jgi:tetratricopeptide (TPR) repeat protein
MSGDDAPRQPERKAAYLACAKLRDQGEVDAAKRAFAELTARFPDYWRAWVALGAIWNDEAAYDAASRCFRRAAELRPSSEETSLALFHSLVSAGQVDDAIVEARRFLDELRRGATCDKTTLDVYVDWDNDGHAIFRARRQ